MWLKHLYSFQLVGNQENFQQRVKEEVEKQTKELMEEKARKEKQLEESNKKLAASDEVLKSLRLNVNVVVRNILGVRNLTVFYLRKIQLILSNLPRNEFTFDSLHKAVHTAVKIVINNLRKHAFHIGW